MSGEPKGEGLPNVLEFLDKARAFFEAESVAKQAALEVFDAMAKGGSVKMSDMPESVKEKLALSVTAQNEMKDAYLKITFDEIMQL